MDESLSPRQRERVAKSSRVNRMAAGAAARLGEAHMPSRPDVAPVAAPATSRLTQSLRRLRAQVGEPTSVQVDSQTQFEAWQRKWEDSREEIADRLAVIDAQLQQFARPIHGPQIALHTPGESQH